MSRPGRSTTRGEIVGGTWFAPVDQALLWRRPSAVPRVLPPLRKGYWSDAQDINNAGQIAGSSGSKAVVWVNGRPRALPGGRGVASAINDGGLIVGSVDARAALWENGILRVFATTKSAATDINNRGQVVGWRTGAGGKVRRGFLWESGAMVDLAGFMPEAINDRGQIVGSCSSGACLWQRGRITTLRGLGYSRPIATGINERQQIVGYGAGGSGTATPYNVAILWTYKP